MFNINKLQLLAWSRVSKLISCDNITKIVNIRIIISNCNVATQLLQTSISNLFVTRNKVNSNSFLYNYLTRQQKSREFRILKVVINCK